MARDLINFLKPEPINHYVLVNELHPLLLFFSKAEFWLNKRLEKLQYATVWPCEEASLSKCFAMT